MYSISPKGEVWILRMMIGADYQSGGRGKAAMLQLIALLKDKYGNIPVYISFDPLNIWAKKLYSSMGFVKDDRDGGDEIVYRLDP